MEKDKIVVMDEGDKEKDVDCEIVNLDTKIKGLDTDHSKEYVTECNRDNDKNDKMHL